MAKQTKNVKPLAIVVAEQKARNKQRAKDMKDGKYKEINEAQLKSEQDGETESED